jgi:hypothetical protein
MSLFSNYSIDDITNLFQHFNITTTQDIDDITNLFQHFNITTKQDINSLCNQFDSIKINPDTFILTKNNYHFIINRIKKCCLEYELKINILPYIK